MPKKKAGKKGGKIVDGISTNEMSREQLLGHIKRIQSELDREREERNFFMLERVKLFSLWNLSQEQIATEKDRSRYMEVLISESQCENEVKMNLYRQKLRFMEAEQNKILGQVRLEHLKKIKRLQGEIGGVRKVLGESFDMKKKELERTRETMNELIANMELVHSQQCVALGRDFIQKVCNIESTFERRLFERINEEYISKKLEIEQFGIQKRGQVDTLNEMHQRQVNHLSTHYQEQTVDNFAVIAALLEELKEKRSMENDLKRELDSLRNSYEHLVENFSMLQNKLELIEFERKREEVRRGVSEAGRIHGKLIKNESKLRLLENTNEALVEKVRISESERDHIKCTFLAALIEIQKKKAMRLMVNELKTKGSSKYPEVGQITDEEENNQQNMYNSFEVQEYFEEGESKISPLYE